MLGNWSSSKKNSGSGSSGSSSKSSKSSFFSNAGKSAGKKASKSINNGSSSSSARAKQYVTDITGRSQAESAQQFENLLPYQQFINQANTIAEAEINPEAKRQQQDYFNQFDMAGSQGGAYKFGNFYQDRGQAYADLERQRNEQIGSLASTYRDMFNDQYTALANQYWKDPNLDQFKPINVAQYNNQTATGIQDINPLTGGTGTQTSAGGGQGVASNPYSINY